MPAATRLWLWGVFAVLLLGLVLMHHVPGHGEHDNAGSAAPSAVASHGSEPAAAAHDPSGCACPHDTRSAGHGGPGAPDLLHLCLAILAAGVMLLVPLLCGLRRPSPAGVARWAKRSVLDHLQPPLPVPRRLAALGVLRL